MQGYLEGKRWEEVNLHTQRQEGCWRLGSYATHWSPWHQILGLYKHFARCRWEAWKEGRSCLTVRIEAFMVYSAFPTVSSSRGTLRAPT